MAVLGQDFGKEICELLGVPADRVVGIDVRVRPHEFVAVMVEMAPNEQQADELLGIIRRFELVEKESPGGAVPAAG